MKLWPMPAMSRPECQLSLKVALFQGISEIRPAFSERTDWLTPLLAPTFDPGRRPTT
jgi:hypothetical protein